MYKMNSTPKLRTKRGYGKFYYTSCQHTSLIFIFRYFSYGASMKPAVWSAFRQSHRIIEREEGPNDGLVSVKSSRWGGINGYKGTLIGVSHLDLINWTNRIRWLVWELTGHTRKYESAENRDLISNANIKTQFQCDCVLFRYRR